MMVDQSMATIDRSDRRDRGGCAASRAAPAALGDVIWLRRQNSARRTGAFDRLQPFVLRLPVSFQRILKRLGHGVLPLGGGSTTGLSGAGASESLADDVPVMRPISGFGQLFIYSVP